MHQIAEMASQRDIWLLMGLLVIGCIYWSASRELGRIERFFSDVREARQQYEAWKRRQS